MVIAPAKTGKDSNKRIAVKITDHGNKGIFSDVWLFNRILIIVAIKLAAPKIEEAPARCSEKIAMSTGGPLCEIFLERGGYTVHPVPAPFSTRALLTNSIRAGIRSHRLILFIRGNLMSGADSIKGDSQFPNPPIITGMTMKKIIKNACAVTIVL